MGGCPLASEVVSVPVDAVVYRKDLYPRIATNPATVQQYVADLSVLPPIEVNQHGELIDGWHRWTAHKSSGVETVPAFVTETTDDDHFIGLAIERNSAGNDRLTVADKRALARNLYTSYGGNDGQPVPHSEKGERKEWLAGVLKVSLKTVRRWTERIDKDKASALRFAAAEMWLAGQRAEDIVAMLDQSKGFVDRAIPKLGQTREYGHDLATLPHFGQVSILGQTADFVPDLASLPQRDRDLFPQWFLDAAPDTGPEPLPIYNVWKQQTKSNAVGHFGNTEASFVDNLLYLCTEPFGMVIDPFAGGGSTIDICKHRLRRYFVSDLTPIVEREHEIRAHDVVTDGPLKPPQWKDVQLVYLDPPYWKQAEGEYSDKPTDLANMELDTFHDALAKIVKAYAAKLTTGAHIALIIQPTQWRAPDRQFTDHMTELLRRVTLPIVQRIQCPYESQQATAQMVNWAKENRGLLVLSREMVVWEVPA